jgi:hypothetical protein
MDLRKIRSEIIIHVREVLEAMALLRVDSKIGIFVKLRQVQNF